ncbi:MAG: hypothetical protein DI586_06215 [Micavibrio aeruginosavorus]|uniref:Uncharacterized protein n=1 Tax=Micavibrio aeruginosavorus TaxID=349221 RepID=A0A2W5FI29_9BACT|nr:MAG: hypothetical protein DI586_06215 [Micavibrio aeruginosavorus]
MSVLTVEQALENIYASLHNNNEGLDQHIDQLKSSLAPAKEVTIDASKIPVPNREGRKTMQAYFKKRGLVIDFQKPA